jgi:hypothetical protein
MWIMTNNSYLSIVSKDCGPAELLVRARRAGDIEKLFPDAKVTRQTDISGSSATRRGETGLGRDDRPHRLPELQG